MGKEKQMGAIVERVWQEIKIFKNSDNTHYRPKDNTVDKQANQRKLLYSANLHYFSIELEL